MNVLMKFEDKYGCKTLFLNFFLNIRKYRKNSKHFLKK